MNDDLYEPPKSRAGQVNDLKFSNLGFWRKLFLVANWVFGIILALLIQFSPFIAIAQKGGGGISLIQMLILFIFAGIVLLYTYWVHRAVASRNITQITILAVVQVIPFLNPIGLLIMLAIRSTSRSELEAQLEHNQTGHPDDSGAAV